jgi:hypothetical protein
LLIPVRLWADVGMHKSAARHVLACPGGWAASYGAAFNHSSMVYLHGLATLFTSGVNADIGGGDDDAPDHRD